MSLPFDLDQALATTDGDRELLEELIEMFKAERPALMQQIRQAIDAADFPLLERSAHSMKGSLANLGGTAAAEVAQKLEQAGHDATLEGAEDWLGQLDIEVSQFEAMASANEVAG